MMAPAGGSLDPGKPMPLPADLMRVSGYTTDMPEVWPADCFHLIAFPPALFRDESERLLAAMAHQPIKLRATISTPSFGGTLPGPLAVYWLPHAITQCSLAVHGHQGTS